MPETIVKNVQEMLNEEKWTRATIGNYTVNNFKDLDGILKQAREAKVLDDLKTACEEHLNHSKNSIIALYLSGMIALSRQLIDDAAMVDLISIFIDNHKWGIVHYLSERMLDWGDSRFPLRTLASYYQNENNEEAVIQAWERLVKIDFEETDIVKQLGEYYEKANNLEEAISYYKKAIHRYLNKKLFSNVREIWTRLLQLAPADIDFYLHVQGKTAKLISEERAAQLLFELFQVTKAANDTDTAIMLLKLILDYDEKDSQARKELVECYRIKYAEHSQLEEYIKISNLSQNWRNIHEALSDFEKHISFDRGNFVFHRSWGVGRISAVKGDEIKIDFVKQRGHVMSLKMAVNALQSLGKEHIWVYKALNSKDKLHKMVKDNPEETLKIIIKSFDNACDLKRIKAELVPSILTPGEWTSWSTKARNILKTNPIFGVSPENIDIFIVKDRPVSLAEKAYNEFKAAKNFFSRINSLRTLVEMDESALESELFLEMFNYFTLRIKSYSIADEEVVASYLFVKDFVTKYKHLEEGISFNFPELFEKIVDITQVYKELKDNILKQLFLSNIKMFIPEWPSVFIKLFPIALDESIITNLEHEGFDDNIVEFVTTVYENYREYKEAVVWFFKNKEPNDWLDRANINYEKQLLTMTHTLQVAYREIENHQNTTENRKFVRQIENALFKDGIVDAYIETATEDSITRIYTLIDDVKDLDAAIKMKIRNSILKRFPKFKFYGTEEKISATRGLIVTQSKLIEKEKYLQHLIDVEVPENTNDISIALAQGDLRENAEYKAAKEKQDMLNLTIARLKDELERAQVFDPSTVITTRVSYGTEVKLTNLGSKEEETYTILGPWESDPENGVISYLSPFGSSLFGLKKKEKLTFKIGDIEQNYQVISIAPAVIK